MDDCIKAYNDLARVVFKVDNSMGVFPTGKDGCRFDHQVLEQVLKDMVKTVCRDEQATMSLKSDEVFKTCPTFVIAKKRSNVDGPPTLFRSYPCREHDADECSIWQAARATTAAPSFFKPVRIEIPSPGGVFIDGGLIYNNPTELVIKEAKKIWTDLDYFCVVSVGTGRQRSVGGPAGIEHRGTSQTRVLEHVPGIRSLVKLPTGIKTITRIAEDCVRLATSSESVHQSMLSQSRPRNSRQGFPYYRFNVERDMDCINLQEWEKMEEIAESTARYLDEEEAHEKLNRCVQDLIRSPRPGRKYKFP